MESEDFIEIGTIVKAHSLNGEVVADPQIDELPEETALLYIVTAKGQLAPYRIESYNVRHKKGRISFFLKFEHVDDRNAADALIGKKIYISSDELPEEEEVDFDDIIAWTVLNNGELFGTVADVFDTPAHTVIDIHHETGSVLVPWVDEYISGTDTDTHEVHAKNLERFL